MTVHVIGAGVAGLSCAVRLALGGARVAVWEGAPRAGGRCRTYRDPVLGRDLDNGNHLLLSGNDDAYAYLLAVGAVDHLTGPARAEFPFLDLETGRRWCLTPGPGRWPGWLFDPDRRVPGSRPWSYLGGLGLRLAGRDATVARAVGTTGPLYRRFWEPLAVAVLNTPAREASARLLWPVLVETFGRGEAACRPRLTRCGLGPALIDPALSLLRKCDAEIAFGRRCKALDLAGDRVRGLTVGDRRLDLGPGDSVVLAVPPERAADLLPGLTVPTEHRAIVNVHYLLPDSAGAPRLIGLIGGLAQWVFTRDDVASVTISAADALLGRDPDDLAAEIWPEVRRALDLPDMPPPARRVIAEKRATFAQTPGQARRRPATRTAWRNLFLAGDWTDTGLPATLEGAIRSGRHAAEAARSFSRVS